MPAGSDVISGDPLLSFHFQVDFPGKATGYFLSCNGLGSETAVIDHKVVAQTGEPINRKLAGRLSWGEVELKRGVTANLEFWQWHGDVRRGGVADARMDGSIRMIDETGTVIAEWTILQAWPSKISGPEAKSDDNNVAMESLTLVHEYIERVT